MKFLKPHLGRVDAELVGRGLHEPLDEVRRLGDAERTPIGDATRSLVRVRAAALHVRGRVVVAAGDDVEEAGAGSSSVARRRRTHPGRRACSTRSARMRPSLVTRELALHVVVACEPRGDEVLGAGLDPLHRPPDHERRRGGDHVARVHRHLVAETAADVGADDPDVLLGQSGDHREHGAVRVRCLRRHVDRRLARRRS